MDTRKRSIALAGWLIALAWLLPAAAGAAGAPDEQLDEITVNGARIKATRDPQKIVNWLKLLVGQFRYDGYVTPRREGTLGELLQVRGAADCEAFGKAPGVLCHLNVAWPEAHGTDGGEIPGGVSTLTPAIAQYGLDPDHLGIRFLQVDNKGIASYGQGYLFGDTLTTTTPCADIPDDCQRITKISAHADGRSIEMQVDIEQDSRRLVRFKFLLFRVGKPPQGAVSGGAP